MGSGVSRNRPDTDQLKENKTRFDVVYFLFTWLIGRDFSGDARNLGQVGAASREESTVDHLLCRSGVLCCHDEDWCSF